MTFSGDLADIGLADVFQNIHGNRLTGTLTVDVRVGKSYIWFCDGAIAGFSRGPNKPLPIGEHVVKRRYVTAQALERVRRGRSKGTTLRAALERDRVLDGETFVAAMTELIQECVYDLLTLKRAEFEFQDGKPPARVFDLEQQSANVRIDPSAILMEGARREDELSRIRHVVGDDRDIFVALEGWQDAELDELHLAVAGQLDGRTHIGAVVDALPHGRFDVLKATTELVHWELARPVTGNELDELAQEALAAGDRDEAVALLRRALMVERGNRELRVQLGELLEQMGEANEAAAEFAMLGYQDAQRGEVGSALEFYARATSLAPEDIGVHEKRVELLLQSGEPGYGAALFEFIEQLVAAGLLEKAQATLKKARARLSATERPDLDRIRAEIEAQLGNYKQASGILQDLVAGLPVTDDEGRLALLRKAHAYRPDDQALADEIADLESGRTLRRRRRARLIRRTAAAAAVLAGLVAMGIVELRASHLILGSLEEQLDDISRGRPAAALDGLERVADEFGYTMSGHRAATLYERLVEGQLDRFRRMVTNGHARRGLAGLLELHRVVTRADCRRRIEDTLVGVREEARAEGLFERINGPAPDKAACAEYLELTDPAYLDFHLRKLAQHKGVRPRAQQVLLQVVDKMEAPRAFAVVAELYLRSDDPTVLQLASVLLATAPHHRQAGHESAWSHVYPVLERAKLVPSTAARAVEALRWLRGGS